VYLYEYFFKYQQGIENDKTIRLIDFKNDIS